MVAILHFQIDHLKKEKALKETAHKEKTAEEVALKEDAET